MSSQLKNRIKGVILLLVFSINTLAGFACSVGMNMIYNEGHHQHDSKKSSSHTEHHHKHDKAPEKEDSVPDTNNSHEDCCGDVSKLNLADKSIASNISLEAPIFLIVFVSKFIIPELNAPSLLDNTTSYSLRRSWNLHDHTDLRIVMQSFQI